MRRILELLLITSLAVGMTACSGLKKKGEESESETGSESISTELPSGSDEANIDNRVIYFDFDKTTLKSESFVELNKVVQFLNDNPTLQIEISGHTDNKGSDRYNENLSQGRAEAVVEYLIQEGIESWRLSAKGYGESKPVATNDTDEGRAENRRVEFTVLAK